MAHRLVAERLLPGDTAIDATIGNGHDTLFLAEIVGESGQVIGFDIQQEAIEETRRKTGELPQVTLHLKGHEHLAELVTEPVKVVMFNLGYLPAGDKALITRPDTTLVALAAAVSLLTPGGILTVVLYTGHPGGKEEAEKVVRWAENLDSALFNALSYQFLNRPNQPPSLIAVERR